MTYQNILPMYKLGLFHIIFITAVLITALIMLPLIIPSKVEDTKKQEH